MHQNKRREKKKGCGEKGDLKREEREEDGKEERRGEEKRGEEREEDGKEEKRGEQKRGKEKRPSLPHLIGMQAPRHGGSPSSAATRGAVTAAAELPAETEGARVVEARQKGDHLNCLTKPHLSTNELQQQQASANFPQNIDCDANYLVRDDPPRVLAVQLP